MDSLRQQFEQALIWPFTDWLWKANHKIPSTSTERAIICVNENNERIFPKSSKIPYLWIPFNDPGDELTMEYLNVISQFASTFHERGLIIHCYAGRNRSSAICWFLLRYLGRYTHEEVKKLFKLPHSNVGIRKSLADKIYKLTKYEYEESWIDH